MTNENQKPDSTDTKAQPGTAPAPQQNQGDVKPSSEKPAGQQK